MTVLTNRVCCELMPRRLTVGQFRKFRKRIGLSQTNLAEEAGLTLQTVSRLERGIPVSEESWGQLMQALRQAAKKAQSEVAHLAR